MTAKPVLVICKKCHAKISYTCYGYTGDLVVYLEKCYRCHKKEEKK